MIMISDKKNCSGCKACQNACSKDAISFKEDNEGCWYPVVDMDKCIQCASCEKACPYNRDDHGIPMDNKTFSSNFFAVRLKELALLDSVSSGGAFQALARGVLSNAGIVYGAAQENVDQIYHVRVTDEDELKKTRRSKYFQSDVRDCYSLAKKDLIEGKMVLFSGTGCQIAGLNCYLGKKYENLYTCEVVCHGVPSRKIWECYRREKEAREGKKIVDLVFRDKSIGWSKNQYKITYEDGSVECERSIYQLFHAGYLQGLFYRPSCGSCPFARLPRVADITLADYWKYKGKWNKNDLGVSLVAVNNAQGLELFEKAKEFLNYEEITKEAALESCRHMDHHPSENPFRSDFLTMVFSEGYYKAAEKYIVIQKDKGIISRIKSFLRRLK